MKTPAKYGFAGFAAVVLAALPVAVLSTAAHAGERVQVSDLNLASPTGQAAFTGRVDQAARNFYRTERTLAGRAACETGVHQEASEKVSNKILMASRI